MTHLASFLLFVYVLALQCSIVRAQVVPITPQPAPTPTQNAGGGQQQAAVGGGAPAAAAGGGGGNNNNVPASPSPTSISIPSSAANGGITITQPVQTADASYYKIAPGVAVTFGWNFTSVLSYPTKLVVQAYCSDNQNTYTIATSLPGTASNVTWSPYQYDQQAIAQGQPALIQATYRLQIFGERGLTVAASPGLFSPNTKVQFALYIPQPYTSISDGWFCSACSGAGSLTVPSPLIATALSTCLALLLASWAFLYH